MLNGNIVTVRGKVGGMFSENMMTVGYPIMINGITYGGIFLCSPVPEIQQTIEGRLEVLIFIRNVGAYYGCCAYILFFKNAYKTIA